MDTDMIVIFTLIGLAIFGVVEVGAPIVTYLCCVSQIGQTYDVTVTVQAVEHSTRFGDHTNLWVRVYGQQDITYKLIGFQDFKVDKTYHIIFIDEAYFYFFLVPTFEIRGRVTTIEEVS